MTIGAVFDDTLFPTSGKNKDFGYMNDAGPYVIVPSFMKQFMVELHCLLVDAIRSAKSARNLIIIGCSLRPEDNHLWLVMSSFLNGKEWQKKRIFVVSPHASDVKERIEKFWANRSIFTERNLVAIDSGFESGLPQLNVALQEAEMPSAALP
jgi:hypothetical protein